MSEKPEEKPLFQPEPKKKPIRRSKADIIAENKKKNEATEGPKVDINGKVEKSIERDTSFMDESKLDRREGKFDPFEANVEEKIYTKSTTIITGVPDGAEIPEDFIERPVIDFNTQLADPVEEVALPSDKKEKTTKPKESSTGPSNKPKPEVKDENLRIAPLPKSISGDTESLSEKEKKEGVKWLVDMSIEAYKWVKQITFNICEYSEEKQRKLEMKGKFSKAILSVTIGDGQGGGVSIQEIINDYNTACEEACNINPMTGKVELDAEFEKTVRAALTKILMAKEVHISPEKRLLFTVAFDVLKTSATIFSAKMTLNGLLKVGYAQLDEIKRKNNLTEKQLQDQAARDLAAVKEREANKLKEEEEKVKTKGPRKDNTPEEEIPLTIAEVIPASKEIQET